MTLTDFLLARISEDEAVARAALVNGSGYASIGHPLNPARVLAECEAKRQIVERCSAVDYAMPSTHLAHDALGLLALPYADHPDYREEWRP